LVEILLGTWKKGFLMSFLFIWNWSESSTLCPLESVLTKGQPTFWVLVCDESESDDTKHQNIAVWTNWGRGPPQKTCVICIDFYIFHQRAKN
jgi:hypothetical protein